MPEQRLHRGRLIDHLQIVVRDIESSRRFYKAVFESLGIALGGEGADHFWCDELFVSARQSPAAAGVITGRVHLAFQADSREMVDRFHQSALAAGGWDNGAPGERTYHPGYYAAFVLDPEGNNIEAVHHGPAARSARSVELLFEAPGAP